MDHWSWTISGLGAMGENNSNLFVQNSLKVHHSIKMKLIHTQGPYTLELVQMVRVGPVVQMAQVTCLWVTSLPRNPYSARQLAKVSQTSLMRTKSTYFSASPLPPCLPPFPHPLPSPCHLVLGMNPRS